MARAEDDSPPVGAALGAGVELASLVASGVLFSRDNDPAAQNRGLYLMASGFVLAPFISHAIDRRWRRAAAFGLASLALTAAAVVEAEQANVFDQGLSNSRRTPFIVLLTVAFFASTGGVVDSFVSDRRER